MAAGCRGQLSQDAVAIEHRSRPWQRRHRQRGDILADIGPVVGREGLDPHDLHGQVVGAAVVQRYGGDRPCRGVEIRRRSDRPRDEAGLEMLVHAIRGQDKDVAPCESKPPVIDIDPGLGTDGPSQITFTRGQDHPVIGGERLEAIAREPPDPAVPDMKQMRFAALEDQRRERADEAVVHVSDPGAPALRMKPGIRRGHDPRGRGPYRPRVRRTVVIGHQALHGRLGRLGADRARTDPVGDG